MVVDKFGNYQTLPENISKIMGTRSGTRLTAEALDRATGRRVYPPSSHSTISSGSRDENEYQHSAVTTPTTRPTRTGTCDEDITLKLKGQGRMKIAGAEIDYYDRVYIERPGGNMEEAGSRRSNDYGTIGDRMDKMNRVSDRHLKESHEGRQPEVFKCEYKGCTFLSKREDKHKKHIEKVHGYISSLESFSSKTKYGSAPVPLNSSKVHGYVSSPAKSSSKTKYGSARVPIYSSGEDDSGNTPSEKTGQAPSTGSIIESFGGMQNFMASYGLKLGEDEADAYTLLEALKK